MASSTGAFSNMPTSIAGLGHAGGGHKPPANIGKIGFIHGVVMLIAFGILFPLGGTVLRVVHSNYVARLHAGWQLTAYTLALAGAIMGLWVSSNGGHGVLTSKNGHKQIGLVVMIIMTIQPLHGTLHHMMFKRKGQSTWYGLLHRWIGRAAVIMGSINIGLGLMLGPPPMERIVAYACITAIFATMYITVTLLYGPEMKRCLGIATPRNDIPRTTSIDTTSTANAGQDLEKEGTNNVQLRQL